MADFTKFNASTHPIVKLEGDWNNLLAHGLEKGFNYIVRINGSYTEAITGTGTSAGTIAYGGADNVGATDGTDSAAVINAALANLTAGRDYKEGVKVVGDYTTNAALAVEGYTVLDLRAAKITLDDGADSNGMTTTVGDDYIDILGGWLQGNSANNASGHGIEIQSNSQEITITGTKIRDFKESGIKIGVAADALMNISYCVITGNTEHGIHATSLSDSFIHHNDIGSNGHNGIYFGTTSHNRIANNGIWLNNQDGGNAGIYLYECRRTIITSNILHDNYRNGCQIAGVNASYNKNNIVNSNSFLDNGTLTPNTYYDTALSDSEAKYNQIIGNTFNSPDVKYNVYPNTNATSNVIEGNSFAAFTTRAVAGTLTGNIIRGNIGYITENSGVTAAAGSPITVAHGLVDTPSTIILTPKSADAGDFYAANMGAANFDVTYDGGGAVAFYWQAILVPTT